MRWGRRSSAGVARSVLPRLRAILVLVVVLLTASPALADGCYIPMQAVRRIPARANPFSILLALLLLNFGFGGVNPPGAALPHSAVPKLAAQS